MRLRVLAVPLLLALAVSACKPAEKAADKPAEKPADELPAGPTMAEACAVPTSPAPTPEETAWRIFVAINCDSGDPAAPRVYQSWTEQYCIYHPTDPECAAGVRGRHPGGSLKGPLALLNDKTLSDECSPMQSPNNPQSNPVLKPFWPANLNLTDGNVPEFCEEVFLNDAEMGYVDNPAPEDPDYNLRTLTGQELFVDHRMSQGVSQDKAIDFPTGAIEIKVDWLPADSLDQATRFDCADPPAGLYTEQIDGTCYGLAGLHMSSKLYPNWLWATFEPQYGDTNPNRCNPDLYGECVDPWGSIPAVSSGSDTNLSPDVAALMIAAGLPEPLMNYRLTGAQVGFVDETVTELGNSFTELNASVAPHQASCITCHNGAAFSRTALPEQKCDKPPCHGAGVPPEGPHVGQPPESFSPNWVRQDFSWFLGFVPQQPQR